ncbi:MAG TPA: sigma-70 family RNA polymerase sigma factor [Dehalococcoidia bacterium]|jgi:RNA polymerase sigma-70 factor (ECF subfamily)|nr:sigma-70 family RNA polymerase sigma factor [Dehalococcoidia bacterium]
MTRTSSQPGTSSDWEPQRRIIEAAQSGDLEALASLYDTHINQVYRYALARLGNVQDAEDVAEEIFIKMLNGLPNYQWRKVPFAAWLMRIAHNEVITFTRRNGRRSKDTELPEELLDRHGHNDPAENAERQLALEDLRKAVELLPEAQREVIILRFAAGLSIADTARALGKQENNVKVLQHKGMQRLQTLMTPKYPELAQRQQQ